MAVAVASKATTSFVGVAAGNTVNVTKPSGISVGDLLIAQLTITRNTTTVTTGGMGGGSSWNQLLTGQNSGLLRSYIFWKIADASDVAAANFTMTNPGSSGGFFGCAVYRITGQGANPVGTIDDTPSGATPSFANTITPSFASSLILLFTSAEGNSNSGSTDSQAIATDNPSWTEDYDLYGDASGFFGGGQGDVVISGSSAIRTQTTATGNSSCTLTGVTALSIGMIVVVAPVVDVTVSPSTIDLVSSVQSPSVSGAATVSPSVIEFVSSVQSVVVTTPDSKWINENKTSVASFTNEDKPSPI